MKYVSVSLRESKHHFLLWKVRRQYLNVKIGGTRNKCYLKTHEVNIKKVKSVQELEMR